MDKMILVEAKKFLLNVKTVLQDKEVRKMIVEIGKEVKGIVKDIGGAK
ncbi:MAG: hypothetical protein PHX21_12755 [bacterium]|nr:hypothetical protein [bacterium]